MIVMSSRKCNVDSADEIPTGRIFTERGLKSVESGFVLNVNRPKEIESATMHPVLAYQSADAECFKVTRRANTRVIVIRVYPYVINAQKPKLRGKPLCEHVGRRRRSRGMYSGGGQWWNLKRGGQRLSLETLLLGNHIYVGKFCAT